MKDYNRNKADKPAAQSPFKSLGVKLWIYFALFAICLLALIWGLQIFLLNNSYEKMKVVQSENFADYATKEYAKYGFTDHFENSIEHSITENDISVAFEFSDGTFMYMNPRQGDLHFVYQHEKERLKEQLIDSESSATGFSLNSPSFVSRAKTFSYATYLDADRTIIMYLFTPIYPVTSTVQILKQQLIYITAIALAIAFILALYLSYRITRPIRSITQSAQRLAAGEYGVDFRGDHYNEIIQLADTLDYTSHELAKTDSLQKDLIANVSHDLRTPLTMIKSYAEMIRDISGGDRKKREDHLQVIIDETDRLNMLVNDLFTISRYQSGNIELNMVEFDLTEAVKELADTYRVLEAQDGYTIRYNAPGYLPVTGDENKLKQAAANLINNAVKYCGHDKTIIISIEKTGNMALFKVEDHGEGIPETDLENIWKRYYKASSTYARSAGTGLGLSIVQEILKLHDAPYGVDSQVGKGSTFWFKLKLSE